MRLVETLKQGIPSLAAPGVTGQSLNCVGHHSVHSGLDSMTAFPPMPLARAVPVGGARVMGPDDAARMNAFSDADGLVRLRLRRLFGHASECAEREHRRGRKACACQHDLRPLPRSEEHTSEL